MPLIKDEGTYRENFKNAFNEKYIHVQNILKFKISEMHSPLCDHLFTFPSILHKTERIEMLYLDSQSIQNV